MRRRSESVVGSGEDLRDDRLSESAGPVSTALSDTRFSASRSPDAQTQQSLRLIVETLLALVALLMASATAAIEPIAIVPPVYAGSTYAVRPATIVGSVLSVAP